MEHKLITRMSVQHREMLCYSFPRNSMQMSTRLSLTPLQWLLLCSMDVEEEAIGFFFFFDIPMCFPGCTTKVISLGRVQVASQDIYLHNAI